MFTRDILQALTDSVHDSMIQRDNEFRLLEIEARSSGKVDEAERIRQFRFSFAEGRGGFQPRSVTDEDVVEYEKKRQILRNWP